jgi:hypothetical protein
LNTHNPITQDEIFHKDTEDLILEKDLPSSPSTLCRRVNRNSQSSATGQHLHSFHSGDSGKNRKQGAHLEHLDGSESRIISSPNVPTNPPAKYHIIRISSFIN